MDCEYAYFLYAMMIFFGGGGNLYLEANLCISSGVKKRSPLLLGLVASELFVAFVSMPATIVLTIEEPWVHAWKELFLFLQVWPIACSTFSMMVISVDRYLTIKNYRLAPQVQGRRRLLLTTVLITWALGTGLSGFQFLHEKYLQVAMGVQVVCIHLVPMLTVVATHLGVHSKLTAVSLIARAKHGELPLPMPLLRRPTHVIIVAGIPTRKMEAGPSKNEDEDLENSTPSTLESRKRLAMSLLWLTAFFTGIWLPEIGVILWKLSGHDVDLETSRGALMIGHLHAVISPFLYMALNRQWMDASCKRFHLPSFNRSPTSTNEDNLGPFHPRLVRAPPMRRRSSQYLY